MIATSRVVSKIQDLVESHPTTCHIMDLDVTSDFKTIKAKALEAINVWGQVDFVVNNAGVGMLGVSEEIG